MSEEKLKPLEFSYNPDSDVLQIEGILYAGEFFRSWSRHGLPVDSVFKIVSRDEKWGTLTINRDQEVQDLRYELAGAQKEVERLRGWLEKILKHQEIVAGPSAAQLSTTIRMLREALQSKVTEK